MTKKLSKKQLIEFKEVFSLLDKNVDGTITPGNLAIAIRALGQHVTEAELQGIVSQMCIDNGGINLEQFISIMSNLRSQSMHNNEIEEALRLFDQNESGLVSTSELRYVLTNIGEKLTEGQVDEVIQELAVKGTGTVAVDKLVKLLTRK